MPKFVSVAKVIKEIHQLSLGIGPLLAVRLLLSSCCIINLALNWSKLAEKELVLFEQLVDSLILICAEQFPSIDECCFSWKYYLHPLTFPLFITLITLDHLLQIS